MERLDMMDTPTPLCAICYSIPTFLLSTVFVHFVSLLLSLPPPRSPLMAYEFIRARKNMVWLPGTFYGASVVQSACWKCKGKRKEIVNGQHHTISHVGITKRKKKNVRTNPSAS
jgi:hypothetical protein